MHTPDGFLDHAVSLGTGVVAAGALAVAVPRARKELLSPDPDGSAARVGARVGMAAAVTSMIFAGQMLNFPVAPGTSGHLLGGVLAAVLLGPSLGMLSLSAVLAVQALVFADGGLGALGTNVLLMAVVGLGTGWAMTRALTSRRPSHARLSLAAGIGGLVSVPVAALAFTGLYALGGTAEVPLGALAAQMLGVHVLVGLGEGIITTAVVAAMLTVAPSAVYTARKAGTIEAAPMHAPLAVSGAMTAVAVVLGGAVARFASAHPDGMEFVAANLRFDTTAVTHALASWPLAEYGQAAGIDVGVAGVLGVLITAAVITAALATLTRLAPHQPRRTTR